MTDQCPFCLMALNKIPTKKIYEDNKIIAILDINPASKGHVLIFPRKHYSSTILMPEEEISSMFIIANKISASMVKSLNVQGINLFLANGEAAGQRVDHVILHVIPRYKGDNIPLTWNPKKSSESELSEIQKLILKNIEKEKPKEEKKREITKISYNEEERIP